MMIIEALRYFRVISGVGGLPTEFDSWMVSFCSGHEMQHGNLITTHILLLLGCAYPFLETYILLDGSVFPGNWVVWSLSGIIFVGIGDTLAAIGGFNYGKNKWRPDSNKT
jgi:dolichol kinase